VTWSLESSLASGALWGHGLTRHVPTLHMHYVPRKREKPEAPVAPTG